jgi:hypothetical protein
MNIYYVYAYLRSKDSKTAKAGTPYYIGKGKYNRAIQRHPGISVPKDRSNIVFIEQNLTNIGACALERRFIEWYGRKDLCTGILHNKTKGGDGGKGGSQKGRMFSAKMRSKLSEAGRKRVQTEFTKHKLREAKLGKKRPPFSKEWLENLSKSKKGKSRKPHTEETKKKLSEKNSRPIYCITNNTWYSSKRNAAVILGLKANNIGHCLQGYQKSTGGFIFSYRKYDDQSFQSGS